MTKGCGNFKAGVSGMSDKGHFFIFGPGFTGQTIAKKALESGWTVSGTFRAPGKAETLAHLGIHPVPFGSDEMTAAMARATHWLVSIAPGQQGDPALSAAQDHLKNNIPPKWIGYLSSTNVYGDHGGDWVDETTPTQPSLDRGKRRVTAEKSWQELAHSIHARCHIFRLAGIYGPGRNAARSLLDGKARRIIKPGQLFSRIHVVDIAEAVWSAAAGTHESDIFNLADDMPSPPQQVIEEAAKLMGITPPAEIPFEEADLSPMARSFYLESKRVKNDRVKEKLGIVLRYPSFREALPELIETEMQDCKGA